MTLVSPQPALGRATTLDDVRRLSERTLAEAGIANAANEAVWIMEWALGTTRLALQLERDRPASRAEQARVAGLVARRAEREPLQYILGTQDFCGAEFLVDRSVLIPRPETELLVEALTGRLAPGSTPTIVDVGTGSGCLAVTLARLRPEATLYATDRSADALAVAERNAKRQGVDGRMTFLQGDLFAPLRGRGLEGFVTVIVSNPPYIPDSHWEGLQPEVKWFEPKSALVGGPDGLAFYRRLVAEAPEWLSSQGLLVVEVGQGQAGEVARIAAGYGLYGPATIMRDAAGIERVVCFQRK